MSHGGRLLLLPVGHVVHQISAESASHQFNLRGVMWPMVLADGVADGVVRPRMHAGLQEPLPEDPAEPHGADIPPPADPREEDLIYWDTLVEHGIDSVGAEPVELAATSEGTPETSRLVLPSNGTVGRSTYWP